ncbi:MAG TPA: hypothetical protein VH834_20435 [Solirubrobacteraceae bacterium]|jgi:hypothetical protein
MIAATVTTRTPTPDNESALIESSLRHLRGLHLGRRSALDPRELPVCSPVIKLLPTSP